MRQIDLWKANPRGGRIVQIMDAEQRIRFCTTPEGVRIAYATAGQGPALVIPPPWISHLEVEWANPAVRSFWETLAGHRTVVRYDRHGCGLSDRARTDFSLEVDLRVLERVVDHLKLPRFALLGWSDGGPVAVAYATRYPRRVSHLILYGTYARGEDIGKPEMKEALTSLVRAHWGVGSKTLADIFLPDAEVSALEWFAKYQRESATGEMAVRLLERIYRTDVTDLLPRVRVLTLVLHRQKDRAIPFRLGRELAAQVPKASFIPLEGKIHLPMFGDAQSVLRSVGDFLGAPVGPVPAARREESGVSSSAGATEDPLLQKARRLLAALEVVVLSRFRVVGGYTRYDETARNVLKDARQRIVAGLERPSRKRENHLVWASPGSGKTFFVQQVAGSLSGTIRYRELNLAKCDQMEFLSGLAGLDEDRPCLCLVDEVDAKPDEPWPYEVLLPHLDARVDRGAPFVFVLVGSSGSSLGDLKQGIASRPKGTDLLSRIPGGNEVEIPPMSIGDRVLVGLSQFRAAGREAGRDIQAVEKMALYYVAVSHRLANVRQLREFAVSAVERVPPGEDRVRFDHLFSPGDPENKAFWMQAAQVAGELSNRFVALEE